MDKDLLDHTDGGQADWEDDIAAADVCVHGRPFDVICVECCPEDDDGSDTGDDWSEA